MDVVEIPVLREKVVNKKIPLTITIGMIILVVILMVSILSITVKRSYSLHYSESSDLDYKVYLKDNDFFEDDYLPKDKQYISSLIKNIEADMNYKFTSEDNIGLVYSYYINAAVVVDNNNGKNLYTKEEPLMEKKTINTNEAHEFEIQEFIKFDYDKYNNIAKKFIDQYNLTSSDAKLVVSLYVDIEGKHTDFDKKIKDKSVVSLSIPLYTQTTDIEMTYDLTNNKNEVLQYHETIITNPILFYGCLVLAIIDVITIILVVSTIVHNRDPKAKYQAKLSSILRIYKEYMCETNITERREDMEKTKNFKVISLNSFDGMMEASDKLKKPILYHEERVGEETVFYLYDDQVCYIYTMKVEDFN